MTTDTAGPTGRLSSPRCGAGRLLLIEDDPDLARLFATALGDAGHAVTIAPTLASAHSHLGGGSWDLVLLDSSSPMGTAASCWKRSAPIPAPAPCPASSPPPP